MFPAQPVCLGGWGCSRGHRGSGGTGHAWLESGMGKGGGDAHRASTLRRPHPFTAGLTVTSCLGCLGGTGFLGALVGADGLG